MHKLVQEALRYSLSRAEKQAEQVYFSRTACQVVADLFPKQRQDRAVWGQSERYLTHAQQVSKWAELWQGEVKVSAVLGRVSGYLFDRGRWREKEPVDERAYELRRKTLDEKHPDTIQSMADLATTYDEQGRYEAAEKIVLEVLNLRRDVLGDKRPDTIHSMRISRWHTMHRGGMRRQRRFIWKCWIYGGMF